MAEKNSYVGWSQSVVYRGLEQPHLFHIGQDELYELDDQGLAFLEQVNGTRRTAEIGNRKLLAFCKKEGLLDFTEQPVARALPRGRSPIPSLRYLEVQLTSRCNLACKHCYLGPAGQVDMDFDLLVSVLDQFENMQGLRLLLSGGEPLLYPRFSELNERLRHYGFRSVLLSNGLLLGKSLARSLKVHEVQVSLDGLVSGHELLRGKGTFARAVKAGQSVRDAGLDLSIATMAHAGNLAQMKELKKLVRELAAREWSIDAPCVTGRLAEHPELAVTPKQAAAAMSLGFGGSYHGAGEGFACGRHLCTVLPDGRVAQCGFYADEPLGHIIEGLRTCWARRIHIPLSKLECSGCKVVDQCAGGCRFRASGWAKDPVMCALYL